MRDRALVVIGEIVQSAASIEGALRFRETRFWLDDLNGGGIGASDRLLGDQRIAAGLRASALKDWAENDLDGLVTTGEPRRSSVPRERWALMNRDGLIEASPEAL